MWTQFYESSLPYKVDITAYHLTYYKPLKDHIEVVRFKTEIDEMIESSIVNAESDFMQSRLQEFRFQAESILKALEKSWELAQQIFLLTLKNAISLEQ